MKLEPIMQAIKAMKAADDLNYSMPVADFVRIATELIKARAILEYSLEKENINVPIESEAK